MFKSRVTPDLINERLELDDGDFVDLCWGRESSRPAVIVLHGLEGSVRSHYAGSLMLALKAALGEGFAAAYLKLKHQEWNSFVSHFSRWEHENTLDI